MRPCASAHPHPFPFARRRNQRSPPLDLIAHHVLLAVPTALDHPVERAAGERQIRLSVREAVGAETETSVRPAAFGGRPAT